MLRSKIVKLEQIDSPNLLIFVPGSWEVGDTGKNIAASEKIVEQGIASVLLYESFRDWSKLESAATSEDWVSAFDGKTYLDELRELRDLISYSRENYNPKNIFLSGHSYGGGLVTLVSGDSDISKILLCAPQILCDERSRELNIYREFPNKIEFLEAISKYKGQLRIVHGTKDKVSPLKQSELLFGVATTPNKDLTMLCSNHSFNKDEEKALYVMEHVRTFD